MTPTQTAADGSEHSHKSPHVQQTISALQREFVCECLRIAAIKASHAADDLEIGDDTAAERELAVAVQNMREAASGFRLLQQALAARDALEEAAR
jgi:hypothetical protein